MTRARSTIDEQSRGLANIQDQDVNFPIVVYIPKSRAPPGFQGKLVEAGEHRHVLERPVAMVAEQQYRLAIRHTAFHQVHLRIDMAVRNEEIEPSVVVHVEQLCSPTHERITRLGDMR